MWNVRSSASIAYALFHSSFNMSVIVYVQQNYGAEALGDIRVDLLRRMTPPYDATGTSPNDPPSIINVSAQSPITSKGVLITVQAQFSGVFEISILFSS